MAHEISRLLFFSRERREEGGWEGKLRGDYCAGPVKIKIWNQDVFSPQEWSPQRGARCQLPDIDLRGLPQTGVSWFNPRLGESTRLPLAETLLFYTRWKYGPGFMVSLFSQAPPKRLIASARKTFLGLWRSRAGWEIISLLLTKIIIEFVFLFFLFLLKSLAVLLKAEKRKNHKKRRPPDWGGSMCFVTTAHWSNLWSAGYLKVIGLSCQKGEAELPWEKCST